MCRSAPAVPNPETVTDKEFADFSLSTYFAWDSCSKALSRVKLIVQSEKEL